MERLKEALSAAGIAYKENEPLCAHCTFRIGGPADLFVLPENEEQLCAAIRLAKEAGVRSYLLGNGSNILFEDAGYRGAVINVSAMKSGIGVIENISFPGKDPALTYDAVVVGPSVWRRWKTASPDSSLPTASPARWAVRST